jgi:hypothetical protein
LPQISGAVSGMKKKSGEIASCPPEAVVSPS